MDLNGDLHGGFRLGRFTRLMQTIFVCAFKRQTSLEQLLLHCHRNKPLCKALLLLSRFFNDKCRRILNTTVSNFVKFIKAYDFVPFATSL